MQFNHYCGLKSITEHSDHHGLD